MGSLQSTSRHRANRASVSFGTTGLAKVVSKRTVATHRGNRSVLLTHGPEVESDPISANLPACLPACPSTPRVDGTLVVSVRTRDNSWRVPNGGRADGDLATNIKFQSPTHKRM
eukprot:m.53819 g.53819  ORF g.53819 m.53819 type:complete len:114 (-) comp7487_c0_seq1:92-433(-)